MTIEITTLFIADTAAKILNTGLELAAALGLPVTSWRAGDPTRSLYKFLAEVLASREEVTSEFIKAGFLSSAEEDWLTIVAREVYGVERIEATPSAPTITLSNAGVQLFTLDAGDVSASSSASGATFHSTSAGTLAPGGTLTLDMVADVAGSDGTAALDEVDTLDTALLGVTITASTAALGVDAQDDGDLRLACTNTLGALSPNGPPDAYEYVALNSALTGTSTITRARSSQDSATGLVTVYLAGADGAVSAGDVTAAQDAIELWATPLCVTPTAVSAINTTVNIVATINGVDVPGDFLATLTAALALHFAGLEIADDGGGFVRVSALVHVLHATIPLASVVVSTPAADVAIVAGHVPKIGTVGITEI